MNCPYHSNGCLGDSNASLYSGQQCMDCKCDKEETGCETIKATSADKSIVMMFVVIVRPNIPLGHTQTIDMINDNE